MYYKVVYHPLRTSDSFVVVDVHGKTSEQFDTEHAANARAEELNAEYERVLEIL